MSGKSLKYKTILLSPKILIFFNELLMLKGFPPKVIWIRLGNCSTKTIESLLRDNYEAILSFEGD
jgi:hypothetical protein